MGDPVTIGLMVASAVMQAMQAQHQAKVQQQIANQQAEASYKASRQKLEAEYLEANRQIAEVQEQEIEESSDLIRDANEEMGTLRVQELALSDASLGNLYFENIYSNSVDLQRLDENVEARVEQGKAYKAGAEQSYKNAITLAQNNLQNVMATTTANVASANLNIVGTGLSAAASEYRHQQQLEAIKKS